MLKQISTVMAILFAAIIVTTLPAMSETDKPDATTEEQQVTEEKKPEPKEIGKKKGRRSNSRRGNVQHKSRRVKRGSYRKGRRTHGRDTGYRPGGHRSHHRRRRRMSKDRQFRGRRESQMMKREFGRILTPQSAKLLTAGQRQEIRQTVESLRQQHRQQMKVTIQELIKGYGIELPTPEQKEQSVEKEPVIQQ